MSNIVSGTEREGEIIFISEAHKKFYYEKLKEVRYQDVYHKALCYCLGISDDVRSRITGFWCWAGYTAYRAFTDILAIVI